MKITKEHRATAKRLLTTGCVYLKVIRESKGIRASQFAKMIDEAPPNLSSLENGKRVPSMSSFVAMADALGFRIVISIERKPD